MAQTRGMSDADLNKLVWTVLGEAAGESETGQAAVMHSILNRVQRYGGTPVSIATGGSQRYKTYSAWNHPADGGNNPQNRYPVGSSHFNKVKGVVERVLSGEIADPTGGATHYWSPKGMPGGKDPYWAESESTQYGRHKIGNHVFLPRAGVPGPTPPRDIPNVVASQLDVNQNTASLDRMVPMPTGVSEREKARDGIVTVNVSPGVLDQQRRQSQSGSDTFQLDRVVPSPRPRPERDSQTTQQAQERVRLPELAPPGHANVPLPRNDPRRPTRMDLAEEQRGGQSQANPDVFDLNRVVETPARVETRYNQIDTMSHEGGGLGPLAARVFAETVLGNRSDITSENLTADELRIVENAVRTAESKGNSVIGYGDYGESNPWSTGTEGVLDTLTDPGKSVANTLGMARFSRDSDGTITVSDTYDFNASPERRDREIAERGVAGSLLHGLQENGLMGVGNVLGNMAVPEGEGRKVELRIPGAGSTQREVIPAKRTFTQQSQANPDIFRLDQVVPPAAGMSQRGLTDSEVNQALGLSTDRSKINAKHARNEAAILSQSGTVPPPAPKAVNTTKIVNGMTMPELNELGKLAPHVTDLENVVAEQVKAQQAADQKALADQNTVKTPTPEEAVESNPFAEIGKAISEGITSLFGGGSTSSDSERAGPIRPSRDGGTNYARDKRLNGGDNSSDRRLPSDGKRYQLNGKEVFAYEATRYNRDTKDFEKYIRYK